MSNKSELQAWLAKYDVLRKELEEKGNESAKYKILPFWRKILAVIIMIVGLPFTKVLAEVSVMRYRIAYQCCDIDEGFVAILLGLFALTLLGTIIILVWGALNEESEDGYKPLPILHWCAVKKLKTATAEAESTLKQLDEMSFDLAPILERFHPLDSAIINEMGGKVEYNERLDGFEIKAVLPGRLGPRTS